MTKTNWVLVLVLSLFVLPWRTSHAFSTSPYKTGIDPACCPRNGDVEIMRSSKLLLRTTTRPPHGTRTTTTTNPLRMVKNEKELENADYVYDESKIKKYNDLAFGLVSLGGLAITQNVDFVGTFVGVSAVMATLATQRVTKKVVVLTMDSKLLPAITATITAVLVPFVMSIHQGVVEGGSSLSSSSLSLGEQVVDLATSSPVEYLLCLASIVIALVDSKR